MFCGQATPDAGVLAVYSCLWVFCGSSTPDAGVPEGYSCLCLQVTGSCTLARLAVARHWSTAGRDQISFSVLAWAPEVRTTCFLGCEGLLWSSNSRDVGVRAVHRSPRVLVTRSCSCLASRSQTLEHECVWTGDLSVENLVTWVQTCPCSGQFTPLSPSIQ